MKNQFKRLVLHKNGMYYQTPYGSDGTQIKKMSITNNSPMTKAQTNGCPCISESQLNSINLNTQSNMINAPYAVVSSETATGGASLGRIETPSSIGAKRKLTLTLTNFDPDNAHSLLIGDHNGFGWDESGMPALSPLVKIGGTFGALTLAKIKQATGPTPFDLHGLHMTSFEIELNEAKTAIIKRTKSGVVFDGGGVSTVDADPAGNSNSKNIIPLFEGVDNDSFNSHIRKLMDWRYLLDAFNSVQVDLPPSSELVMNFYINGVARHYVMKKL